MKETIEFAVKALAGFFVLNQIIGLVGTLRKEYVALRIAILSTSKAGTILISTMVTGAISVVKNMKYLRGAIIAVSMALKNLNKSNALLFIISIGVAAFGDKIMEWVDQYIGKSKENEEEDPTEDPNANKDNQGAPNPIPYGDPPPTNPLAGGDNNYYQNQSKSLDQNTQRIKQYYGSILGKMAADLEALNESYDSSGNIADQAQLRYNIAEAQQIYDAVQGTAFEDPVEKDLKLGDANLELEKFKRELDTAAKGLQGIAVVGHGVQASGNGAVNAAKDLLETPYGTNSGELVCTQYVKAALEKAGISLENELSDYVPTMVAQAKEKGIWKDANNGYTPKAVCTTNAKVKQIFTSRIN